MSYRVVFIEHLMEHEFAQVEGDLNNINANDLISIAPNNLTPQALLTKINNNEYVLLNDVPETPLLIRTIQKNGQKKWYINDLCNENFQPGGLDNLTQRVNTLEQKANRNTLEQEAGDSRASNPNQPPKLELAPEEGKENYSDPDPSLAYEYNFEVAFSAENPINSVRLHAQLYNQTYKVSEARWDIQSTPIGSKYTLKTNNNKDHSLKFCVGNNTMGLSLNKIKLVTLGAGVVHDAFVPVMPAVQFGDRLALATAGYLYHFKGTELIQKYQWMGEEGLAPLSPSSAEHHFNHRKTAILVYWKLGGGEVKDQYLLYSKTALSNTQLKNMSQEQLETDGVHLNIGKLLSIAQQDALPRETPDAPEAKADFIAHKVKEDPNTGNREQITDIAAQYGLTPLELMNQNPSYMTDLSSLQVGSTLSIRQLEEKAGVVFKHFELPPESPNLYNSTVNSHYAWGEKDITLSLSNNDQGNQNTDNTTKYLPIHERFVRGQKVLVNVRPERILRIGVFFDGMGQNKDNDAYKEDFGDKSRTNIARLFDAYPEETGKNAKIYVSGIGTVDSVSQDPSIIDKGKDEIPTSGTSGILGESGAYEKWQDILIGLSKIVRDLEKNGVYHPITHFAFDLFGFGHGATLAQHFVNAVKLGIPDYNTLHTEDNASNKLHPNLLGSADYDEYNAYNDSYQPDTSRTASVRFLGLFDTVSSFYSPDNKDNGHFQQTIAPKDVGRAFHITAHHEYRNKYPLTSLKTYSSLPANFYEEVFPGAHKDVGGGYPFVKQYTATGLSPRYGVPTQNTYNRELEKITPLDSLPVKNDNKMKFNYLSHTLDYINAELREQSAHWNQECQDKFEQHGLVTEENKSLYFYRLQPIDASLSGLSQERMKQQAEAFGVKWNSDNYKLPEDYAQNTVQQKVWSTLMSQPIGNIEPKHWQADLPKHCIHRSHDSVINPGCSDDIDSQTNAIANTDQFKRYQPKETLKIPTRETFDNI